MIKSKLLRKVLAIVAITLCTGFAGMGLFTLYLQYGSSMNLQEKAAQQLATTIDHNIRSIMMKGDLQEYDTYVQEIKKQGILLDIILFNNQGKIRGGATLNDDMKKSLDKGLQLDVQGEKDGKRALTVMSPLENEKRCHACHDPALKFLGGVAITTSLQEGYNSAIKLALIMSAVGVFFFFAIMATLYFLLSRIVVKQINDLLPQITMLAAGGGDLTTTISVTSNDEIGDLGNQVNLMTSKIREIIALLYKQACMIGTNVCELSAANDSSLKMSQEQKDESMAVAVASDQMAMTINEVTGNVHRAATLSTDVDSAANNGMAVVQDTWDCMRQLSESASATLETIKQLENSSSQIGEMVSLIEDIADQTNLLALNASIELSLIHI